MGWPIIDIPALTANISATVTDSNNKTNQGRLAGHLGSLPKLDVYATDTNNYSLQSGKAARA
jgi:hypothetical protein